MNWEAVGAVAEALGVVGVIVSLIYLALQIRHNTRVTRLDAAFRVMHATTTSTGLPLIQDADLSAKVLSASAGDIPVDPGERLQATAWFFVALKTVENAHYQYQQGALHEDVWRTWENFWSTWVQMPGFRRYWEDRRSAFLPGFQRVVDTWVSDGSDSRPPMKPIGKAAEKSSIATEG